VKNVKKLIPLIISILALFSFLIVPAQAEQTITITKGGTYTDLVIANDDANAAAVTISTSDPVILENCSVTSRGTAISADSGADVTVRNCYIECQNPLIAGMYIPRAIKASNPKNLVVQNNYFNYGGGIYVLNFSGDGSLAQTINISFNKFQNIDGHASTGADGGVSAVYYPQQAVQFDKVYGIKNCEISWNEIINEPYKSRSEDNINMYKSSGMPDNPIRIHDNFISGADGGGIICDGNAALSGERGTGYVEIYNNTVTNFANYGIAIAAGNNNTIHDNIVVNSGQFPDGGLTNALHVGIYITKAYSPDYSYGNNNNAYNNLCGNLGSATVRNDYYLKSGYYGSDTKNNLSIQPVTAAAITPALELEYCNIWNESLTANNIKVGIKGMSSMEILGDDTVFLSNNTDKEMSGRVYVRKADGVEIFDNVKVAPNGTLELIYTKSPGPVKVFFWDDQLRPFFAAAEKN